MRHRARGQALLEFALIAPMLFLLIGATVDLGRGLLIYTTLQGASRDMARQAVLSYYSGSNSLPPDCTALVTPCTLGPLTNGAHQLDALGMKVVYLESIGNGVAPSYGLYTPSGGIPPRPGTIAFRGIINASTVYVFVYEFDPVAGTTRWSCSACGGPARTPSHQFVVVDLKLQWKPVLNTLLGIPSVITFDSQSVERLEY